MEEKGAGGDKRGRRGGADRRKRRIGKKSIV